MAENNGNGKAEGKKYFTQIPNMIDEMDLSVYAVRLYFRAKRRAGEDGLCWESTGNLAKGCHMSEGSVSQAKQDLVNAGLISITKRKNPNGGKDSDVISILDVWNENIAFFTSSQHEQPSSPHELANSLYELTSSTGEIKKNPLSNNPIKNNQEEEEVKPISLSSHAPRDGERELSNSSTSNLTSLHPFIEMFQSITGVDKGRRYDDYILSRLGGNPDWEKLQRVFDEWNLEGNRATNTKGILDWYEKGIPERGKKKKAIEPENPYIVDEKPGSEIDIDWCPENLKLYFYPLFNETGIYPYTAKDKRKWLKELQNFRDYKIDPRYVREAINRLREQPIPMIIASPKSVLITAQNLQANDVSFVARLNSIRGGSDVLEETMDGK